MPRSLTCPFFKTWTPDMAYILGYWFADGNMYFQEGSGGYFVSIASKDTAHLQAIRYVIGAGSLRQKTRSDVYELVICRKEAYDDLLRLGGTERKSLTLTWPDVPTEFLAHFTRGYIDGDGCLSWHRTGNSIHPVISVVGTKAFLVGMGMALQEAIGIPIPTPQFVKYSNGTSAVKWYGVRAKCLAIWLYHNYPGLCLARKMALAIEFSRWKPRVFDPTTTTRKMWELFRENLP